VSVDTVAPEEQAASSVPTAQRPPSPARLDRAVLDRGAGGVWAWLFQRVTAVFLLYGMAVHLISTHILAIGKLDFGNIADRLGSNFFVVTDVLLLAAVLYHALNGARMVVLDYWLAGRTGRLTLTVALWIFGLATFAYGLWALWPWITQQGRP